MYQALHEIAVNTVKGKIPLSGNQKRRLFRYMNKIKALSKQTKDNKKRRRQVVQSGGFLPILIPAVASILTSLLTK